MKLRDIDMEATQAAISLLRVITYHERQARRAEARDLEESLHYHEASRKDAEELVTFMKSVGRKKLLLGSWKREKQQKPGLSK